MIIYNQQLFNLNIVNTNIFIFVDKKTTLTISETELNTQSTSNDDVDFNNFFELVSNTEDVKKAEVLVDKLIEGRDISEKTKNILKAKMDNTNYGFNPKKWRRFPVKKNISEKIRRILKEKMNINTQESK